MLMLFGCSEQIDNTSLDNEQNEVIENKEQNKDIKATTIKEFMNTEIKQIYQKVTKLEQNCLSDNCPELDEPPIHYTLVDCWFCDAPLTDKKLLLTTTGKTDSTATAGCQYKLEGPFVNELDVVEKVEGKLILQGEFKYKTTQQGDCENYESESTHDTNIVITALENPEIDLSTTNVEIKGKNYSKLITATCKDSFVGIIPTIGPKDSQWPRILFFSETGENFPEGQKDVYSFDMNFVAKVEAADEPETGLVTRGFRVMGNEKGTFAYEVKCKKSNELSASQELTITVS